MSSGMLWFDDSKDTLEVKIKKALAYYKNKYNQTPNECLVHPSLLKDEKIEIPGLSVRGYRPVLPGHIWLGMKE